LKHSIANAWKCLLAMAFLVLVAFPAVIAQSTPELSGAILDPQSKGVNGALVVVKNTSSSATKITHTDASGNYSVDGLPAGAYTVTVNAIGFATGVKSDVTLTPGQTQQAALTLSISSVAEQITVNAGVESIAAQSAPSGGFIEERSAQSLVSNHYIENFTSPVADYGEIVQIVPGTFTTSTDGVGLGQSKTYFRGFADGSYDIDFDGIPFFDTNSPSHHSWAFFPSQWVGGVDVDRSPGTASTIGPDPFGGTIHLLSKPMTSEQDIRGTASWSTWNTELYDGAYNSGPFGVFGSGKKMNLFVDWHHMSSNGFQTQNYNQRDGGSLIFQYQLSPRTVITGFSGVIQTSTNAPNISSTRCQLYGVSPTGAYSCANANTVGTQWNGLNPYTGTGIKFLLTAPNSADPANWFSSAYNKYHIPTDFEYVGLKKEMGKGWYLDFKGYTYDYDNAELYSNATPLTEVTQAAAVANPSLVPGAVVIKGVAYYDGVEIEACNGQGATTPVATTPFPCGIDKYNSYRKYGETSLITQTSQLGVFRAGMWYEWANTNRHQAPADPLNNWADQALPLFNETFYTNSSQPYAEYEFHVTPQLNITPGFKYFLYNLNILHHADDGGYNSAGIVGTLTCPANLNAPCSATVGDNGTFTAPLPTLDANFRIQNNWSVYGQASLGAAAPLSKVYDFSHTVSATNPSPALESPAKMQKSTTYQIGSVYKGNRITLDGDIYRVRFDNTYSSTTDTVTTDSTYGQEIWFLNPASVTQGMEFETTAVLAPGLNLYLNGTAGNAFYSGTLNAGTFTAPYKQSAPAGLWVAGTPSDTEFQGLTYDKHGLDLGFFNHRVGEQRVDNGKYHNQAIIAPFNTVNTFINYTVRNRSFLDGTKIRLAANNLLNTDAIQSLSLGGKAATTTFVGTNGVTYTDQFNATSTINGADTPSLAAGRSYTISVTFGIAPRER